MPDLVVFSLEDWDDVWRRNQYFVQSALHQRTDLRVLFVEPPVDVLHSLVRRRVPAQLRPRFRKISTDGIQPDRLWTFRPTKLWPRKVHPNADLSMARAVRRAADRLAFQSPVLWVNDPGGSTLRQLTTWPTVYDITDDWLLAERPPQEIDRLQRFEQDLLTHAQAVVACSSVIAATKATQVGGDLYTIGNGVDLSLYRAEYHCPADLPPGSALYVGTLHSDRLDIDLSAATAQALSRLGRTLVFVGPDSLEQAERSRLIEAGAILLGPRSRETVPAYLVHADVLLVPHVVTPFTQSLDPIKAYEYKAARRPVVSTPVSGFIDLQSYGAGQTTEPERFVETVLYYLGRARDWKPREAAPDPPDWADQGLAFSRVLSHVGGWAPT